MVAGAGLLLFLACQPDDALRPAANRAPTASIGGPYSDLEGATITFDGHGSRDPDGDSLTYSWDFGDGVRGTNSRAGHVFRLAVR